MILSGSRYQDEAPPCAGSRRASLKIRPDLAVVPLPIYSRYTYDSTVKGPVDQGVTREQLAIALTGKLASNHVMYERSSLKPLCYNKLMHLPQPNTSSTIQHTSSSQLYRL
jgi:hypothetical protein